MELAQEQAGVSGREKFKDGMQSVFKEKYRQKRGEKTLRCKWGRSVERIKKLQAGGFLKSPSICMRAVAATAAAANNQEDGSERGDAGCGEKKELFCERTLEFALRKADHPALLFMSPAGRPPPTFINRLRKL